MTKKYKISLLKLSLLIAISLFSGCSTILGGLMGIHEPKKENKGAILNYAIQNKIDTSSVFLFSEDALSSLYKSTYKPGYEPGLRPIQMMGFDKTGELKMHWASCEGTLNMLGTLKTFPPKNGDPFFTGIKLESELQKLRTLNDGNPDVSKVKQADYVFIVYWAIWTDKQTKNLIKDVETYTKKYPDVKFEVLMVNTDKRESSI